MWPAAPVHNRQPDGQGVLVTRLESGTNPQPSTRTFAQLGRLLAQLHSLPAGCKAAARPGGAWHHLVLDGAPSEELAALSSLFDAARHRVSASEQGAYDALAERLRSLDDCRDLPQVVVHPDFVPRNIIQVRADSWIVIDCPVCLPGDGGVGASGVRPIASRDVDSSTGPGVLEFRHRSRSTGPRANAGAAD
jgi:hypothetical protein